MEQRSETKEGRVDFRLTNKQKELLAWAAQLSGMSLSTFVKSSSIAAANRAMAEYHLVIPLSGRDWEGFLKALDAKPEPTKKAIQAAEDYNKGEIAGDEYRW